MKAVMRVIVVACLLLGLAGCGTTAKEMSARSLSERNDVFAEVKTGEAIPQGYAVLTIRAAIKLPDGQKGRQEKGYPFLVNINGQAALWQAEGIMEKKPVYDKDGSISRDPEAGEGIRHSVEKRVQLRPGRHSVFFGLPEDDCFVEKEITLREGEEVILEYRPVYRQKARPIRVRSFLKGIREWEVFFKGEPVQ